MTSTIIRLVLDKCANVNEAIELFKSVDINDEAIKINILDLLHKYASELNAVF